MKKLLSLLCVLATSGTVMPLIVAAAPYQIKEIKLKNNINYQQTNNLELKRNKRGVDDGNELVGLNTFYASFKPNLWEEIIIIKYKSGNDLSLFQEKVSEKFKAHKFDIWNWFITDGFVDNFLKLIFNNWNYVNFYWRNSTKRERIRIVTKDNMIISVSIRTGDTNYYQNDYLNNQIINEVLINRDLGKLFIINQQTILNSIKLRNWDIDISHLSVSDITNKSAKITVNLSGKYTKGTSVNVYFEKNDLINLSSIKNIKIEILNSNETAILNELNYLNYDLDISQLELYNIINTSAIIKAKKDNSKYFDEKKIYFKVNNQENKIIDLSELIKKGIFLSFRDKNKENIIKEINNIDENNLIYSNIKLTKDINEIYNKNTKEICNNIVTLTNDSSEIQNIKTNSCTYKKEKLENIKIKVGLKNRKISSQTSTTKQNSNFELSADIKAKKKWFPKILDLTFGFKGKYQNEENFEDSKIQELSNEFDLSENKEYENKETSEITIPSQEIKVNPRQKIKFSILLDQVSKKIIWNLKQNIHGEINAEITNEENMTYKFKISIKEIMQKLKQYNLLPQEITINNDDTITFNGKLMGSLQQTLNSKIKIEQINNYDVLHDGSCLFWSVATAYFLPVRNNDDEFRARFIQLFGEAELRNLSNIQTLLQQFDLENNRNLQQSWYQDQIANNLVTTVFRNRVVDYIQSNLNMITNRGSELTFRNVIEENNVNASNYLEGMRQSLAWGGTPEILAMSNFLNSNISVNNHASYQPINQNSNNNIQIFHVNGNHYNFGLGNQTPQTDKEYQRSVGGGCLNEDDNDIENNSLFLNKPQLKKDEYHFIVQEIEQKSLKNDENLNIYLIKNQNQMINKYNSLSREAKQQKLNEINQHYQTLPENEQKTFKDKLKAIGTSAIGAGISAVGTKMAVSGSASTTIGTTGEAMEMMPLLSEGGLAAAETLSVAEGTAVVVTEGAVIGAEAATAGALAPETLGLSLVIGGLAIAGTAIIWWLSHDNNVETVKHESHNQYNEIEKYYQFLAHDQLKLDIDSNTWDKIKQIYQENANNYQEFKNKIKSEITNFKKEDHSGWGGSITDEDINTLIKIIYNHFQEINNYFSSNPNHGWKIVTNTIGNYFIIEEE